MSTPSTTARVEGARAPIGELLGGHAGGRVVGDQLDEAERLAGLGANGEDGLGDVVVDLCVDAVAARRVDEVPVAAGHRHPRVGAAIPEHDLALVVGRRIVSLEDRFEHAVVEPARPPRVEPLTERGGGDVILVLAVLAVHQLRRDHHRRGLVEQRDIEGEQHEVAMGEARHPRRRDTHPLARRRAPHQRSAETTGGEVEDALVLVEVCTAEQQRLVVDVELDQLGVGHVDDRLTGLGEAVRILGVTDVPRLVEPVQERAVAVRVAALLRVGAHADIAVADGEQRLGVAEIGETELGLDRAPGIDREPMAGEPSRFTHACPRRDRLRPADRRDRRRRDRHLRREGRRRLRLGRPR